MNWKKYWIQISMAFLTTLISGILLTAWLSFLELKQLVWQAPIVMERIAKIENKVDRIERLVRIRKEDDKVVRLIEEE